MNRYLLLVFFLVLISSCSNDDDKKDSTNVSSSEQSTPLVPATENIQTPSSNDIAQTAITKSEDGRLYLNKYFGLKVTKPDGWYASEIKDLLALQQLGVALYTGSNDELKANVLAALDSNLPLFGFYRTSPETSTEKNANMLAIAENVKNLSNIRNGCEYLGVVKSIMVQAPLDYTFSEGCKVVNFNGRDYGSMDVTLITPEISISQSYFATVKDGYAMFISETYFSDEDKAALDSIMVSLYL